MLVKLQRLGWLSLSLRSCSALATMSPIVPRREEDRGIWLGPAPEGWDTTVPRQSSNRPLISPTFVKDPYGWMRDDERKNVEVLDHLKLENEYTQQVTSHLSELRSKLYSEFKSHIQETDCTLPRPRGPFWYATRTIEGKSYPIHVRFSKKENEELPSDWETSLTESEEVLLDVNVLAEGQTYCATGSITPSPSHKLLAYAVDFSGDETCQVYIKDMETLKVTVQEGLDTSGTIVWGADDDTIFYCKQDAAHRPYQVFRRNLSTQTEEMLWEESDELFWMGISKSLDGRYLLAEVSSKETSEIRYLDLHQDDAQLKVIAERRPKVLYEVEHAHGDWWISSNVGGLPDMALFRAPVSGGDWELVKNDDEVLFDGQGLSKSLADLTCLNNVIVCEGRQDGLPQIWLLHLNGDKKIETVERLEFPEAAYDVGTGRHYEFDADTVVLNYDSLVTPTQTIEVPGRRVLKQKKVPGYNPELYTSERTTVLAQDGKTQIPVSLVYRKDSPKTHAHLYGYGSYGSCIEADFSSTRLALLDRGIVYAIAHIRGGGEMGRYWYEKEGKYLTKKVSSSDGVLTFSAKLSS